VKGEKYDACVRLGFKHEMENRDFFTKRAKIAYDKLMKISEELASVDLSKYYAYDLHLAIDRVDTLINKLIQNETYDVEDVLVKAIQKKLRKMGFKPIKEVLKNVSRARGIR